MDASGSPGEDGFTRLFDLRIALPALVLELEMLNRDGVRIGIEVGQRLVLGDPAAVNLVGERELARFVVDLENHVLAEVLQADFGAKAGADMPHLVGPAFELEIVCDATLECDRLVLCTTRRLARGRWVAAPSMLDDLGPALERAGLADSGHVAAVPLETELEVLVRVEAVRVDGELGHVPAPLLQIASNLLDGEDDEFRRLQRREADDDVDDAKIAIGLRRR